MLTNNKERTIDETFTSPLIFNYVLWVLNEAVNRDIKTLYFLARDGYKLREVAIIICKHFNINIKCKYFYCSRASLRLPTYFFIGEEALELLTLRGYSNSYYSVLNRLDLTETERATIYQECDCNINEEQKLLSDYEFDFFINKLKKSPTYLKLIIEKSKKSYNSTIGYLRQEGVFDESEVAIVDSGWTGSMQRSLRQLLQSGGYNGKLIGFYFGMYSKPKEPIDGTYLTFWFNSNTHIFRKIIFNNNVFEVLLSAPHGMTKSYLEKNNNYIPELLKFDDTSLITKIEQQSETICEYTNSHIQNINNNYKINYRKINKLIYHFMTKPSRDVVQYIGSNNFCDDITENYYYKLSSPEQISVLNNYSIIKRFFRKVTHKKTEETLPKLFWAYGTIAFLPNWKQVWYRWNIYIWEFLRYAKK